MPISLECNCGKKLKVKDESAGRKVRCPGCAAVIAVPKPEVAPDADEEALGVFLADSGDARPTAPPATTSEEEKAQVTAKAPWERPSPPRAESKRVEPPAPKPRRQSQPRREDRSSYSGLVISPAIISGVLMMLGAVIWFVAGLAFGYIYFYPPIMFVLGIGAVIKGFRGQED